MPTDDEMTRGWLAQDDHNRGVVIWALTITAPELVVEPVFADS